MNNLSNTKIVGIGAYLPKKRLTNYDLEKIVETSDEWIVQRTGIRERRIAEDNEFASDMAIHAVQDLITKYNANIDDVDMIIASTFTPDHFTPTVAGLVQGHFNMQAGTMDINSGCAGFVYSLCVADSLITTGHSKKILIVSSETISKVTDYSDRKSCILFGDAATAFLVERTEGKGSIVTSSFCSDGQLAQNVTCTNLSHSVNGYVISKNRLFDQEGRFVYEYAVRNVPGGVQRLINKAGLSFNEIDWFVPHSANVRIIKSICERLDFPIEKTLLSLEYYGNTSSVTIPLAMWLALEENKIAKGNNLMLYGFGGGLTHGGLVVKW